MAGHKYSKEIQDFLDAGGVIKVIPPEDTAKTLEKQNNGYFKARPTMGPTKKKEESE
jgi:hypothetical protein